MNYLEIPIMPPEAGGKGVRLLSETYHSTVGRRPSSNPIAALKPNSLRIPGQGKERIGAQEHFMIRVYEVSI